MGLNVHKMISEEGWVIQLSLGINSIELSLEEAQMLVSDLIVEFKDILDIEEDSNGEEGNGNPEGGQAA